MEEVHLYAGMKGTNVHKKIELIKTSYCRSITGNAYVTRI